MLEFSPAEGRLAASSSPSHHAVHPGLMITLNACHQEPPVRELLLGTVRQELVSLIAQLGLCWQRRAPGHAGPSG